MAKADLFRDAKKAGLVPADASADDFTEAQLKSLLNPDAAPLWEGSMSSSKPIIAPDGHVTLSQEDIDARSA